jgi:ferritin-like metal-binding protein YciE
MAKSETLKEMLIVKLQALYDVESELIDALPKMSEAATDPSLKQAFTDHLEETRGQAKRLETVFETLGEKASKEKCEGIRGLVKDSEWVIANTAEGDALDAALIAAAQTVEAYEAAIYAAAQTWAEKLGNNEIASLLKQSEGEELNAGIKLGNMATEIMARLTTD